MTNDRDIEQYVESHYNPEIQTPEEYIASQNFGSEVRGQIALRRAEAAYEVKEEREKLEAQQQEESDQTTETGGQQGPQEEESERGNVLERGVKFVEDLLRGIFGG